ncbi:MAG: hypothetical protein RLZZ40_565 [Actinomycetota bacterium]
MATRHAVVAGGSGFIGRALVRELRAQGWDVTTLVRRAPTAEGEVHWDPAKGELDPSVVSAADAVINLAGSSISRMPWTATIKQDILESRRQATTTIVTAINTATTTPAVLINASAIGIYGNRGDEVLTEKSARGTGFLSDVVVDWEKWAEPATCRTVLVRTGLVLGSGGAMSPLALATLAFVGGRVGTGTQWWPWISLRDEVRAIVHLIDSKVSGPVNLVGPEPATATTITKALAKILRRPHLLGIPPLALSLFGEAGRELLQSSTRIEPTVLIKDGFTFEQTTAEDAVRWAISNR